jgi:hypothetical protein
MLADIIIFKEQRWAGLQDLRKNPSDYQLLMVFGERNLLTLPDILPQLSVLFPDAKIVSASTAGEVYNSKLHEETVICIAIHFEKTTFELATGNIRDFSNSFELGNFTTNQLAKENLRYIMVLSDGNVINGDDLIAGINSSVDNNVEITGFMAGDGDRFEKTLTGVATTLDTGNVTLLGLYGNQIHVTSGIKGGWSMFGPERTVTKSNKNEVFEIDGESALDLYKRYLGKFAEELPSSALFFPIALIGTEEEEPIVRTILRVNEEKKSMIFAGNITEGAVIRLMRTNTDQVISMAGEAANHATKKENNQAALALIFNCIGRKLILASRANDELNSIRKCLPPTTTTAGLYSYGEFSKLGHSQRKCALHNQTVVVTLITEN